MNINKRENAIYTVYVHILPKSISDYEWDKYYVGITKLKVEQRWRHDGSGYKGCLLFHRAIQKYGFDAFEHEIIASNLTEDEAKKMEIALIRELRSNDKRYGYNMTGGGDGSLGMPCPEKARKAASERFKKYWEDPEFRAAHSGENASNYGKRHKLGFRGESPFAKKVVCLNTGKHYECIMDASEEINRCGSGISDNCSGKTNSAGIDKNGQRLVWAYKDDYDLMTQEEINAKIKIANKRVGRKVINLDTKEYFANAVAASEKYNIKSSSSIYGACKGRYKQCGGYHWQYYDDYLKENNLTDEEAHMSLFFIE